MTTILVIWICIRRTSKGFDLKHHGVGHTIWPIVIAFRDFHNLFRNNNTATLGYTKVMSIGGIKSNTASAIAKSKAFCSKDGVGKAIRNSGEGNRRRKEPEVVFAPKPKRGSCITLRSPKDIPIGEVVSGGPPLGRKRIQWKTTKVCIGLEMQLQQNK